jgi:hypothetical protein
MFVRFLRRGGWLLIALLVLGVGIYYLISRAYLSVVVPVSSAVLSQPVGDLPNMPVKPEPGWLNLDGCPPAGRGGDTQLNLLKNRMDQGDYVPVSFSSLTALTWPKTVEGLPMSEWPASSRSFIERYAGIPVSVEGFIVNIRDGEPEPANCGRTGEQNVVWRMNLAGTDKANRSQTLVIESTPQARVGHTWSLDLIRSLIVDPRLQVRVSGWLFFDPEHPWEVGRVRATLWEIRPVMQIEVFQDGRWFPLDRFGKASR